MALMALITLRQMSSYSLPERGRETYTSKSGSTMIKSGPRTIPSGKLYKEPPGMMSC